MSLRTALCSRLGIEVAVGAALCQVGLPVAFGVLGPPHGGRYVEPEQLCDTLDRCRTVSLYLLERAPVWLGDA